MGRQITVNDDADRLADKLDGRVLFKDEDFSHTDAEPVLKA